MSIEIPVEHQKITNVQQTAWAFVRNRRGWWLLLFAVLTIAWVALGIRLTVRYGFDDDVVQVFLFIPMMAGGAYWSLVLHKVRERFWRQFAETRGFTYHPKGDHAAEAAVMFHQGHGRRMLHVISGQTGDRALRVFSYQFTVGSGKSSRTYPYTVFEFRFASRFPHLYCNQRYNNYGVTVGVTVPLPAEFEKKFAVRAPKEYEIEALEVFTPDLLAYLLDSEFAHDLEIVDQELLIFTAGFMNTVDDLERKFNDAVALANRLAPKLDRFRFTPIGQLPHTLT